MIGVLIAAHGFLAKELLETAEKIIGHQPRVAVLSTSNSRHMHELEQDAGRLVDSLDSCDGVLVMVDSPGGTPANICLKVAHDRTGVEVVSGVNLPMMMSLVDRSEGPTVKELASAALSAGKDTIRNLTDVINGRGEADCVGSSKAE